MGRRGGVGRSWVGDRTGRLFYMTSARDKVLALPSILGKLAEHPTITRLDHPKLIECLELAKQSLEESLENFENAGFTQFAGATNISHLASEDTRMGTILFSLWTN